MRCGGMLKFFALSILHVSVVPTHPRCLAAAGLLGAPPLGSVVSQVTDGDLVYVVGLSWADVRRMRAFVAKVTAEAKQMEAGNAEVFGFEHWEVRREVGGREGDTGLT